MATRSPNCRPVSKVIASNDACAIAAMPADEFRKFYAVQFHPEVTHTIKGKEMIARFVHEICGCGHDWNMPDYVNEAIAKVRAQVGNEEVILGLSGGVDSSVVAALLHRAIGDQLTCVFVDNGLLRLNEAEQVMQTFARNLGVRSSTSMPLRSSWATSRAFPTRRPSARSSAANSSRSSRPRRRSCPRKMAGAGHHLPGRDRIGRQQDRQGAHDQEPPQRRRSAGNAQSQAARTAARTVQGRSTRTRHRPRPAARNGLSPPVPGARASVFAFSVK